MGGILRRFVYPDFCFLRVLSWLMPLTRGLSTANKFNGYTLLIFRRISIIMFSVVAKVRGKVSDVEVVWVTQCHKAEGVAGSDYEAVEDIKQQSCVSVN